MNRRAVFMDRDGVINRAIVRDGVPHPPSCLEELQILPHVPEALDALKACGFPLIVVTNQPDVARGISSRSEVERIHRWLEQELDLDAIFTCFHDSVDGCGCRKPKPGLLMDAARALDIDLCSSFMIGDRSGDIEAGRRAGCATFFIDYGYREVSPAGFDHRVESLLQASKIILETRGRP